MFYTQEQEAREDEMLAQLGDPRRCQRHPHMVTSSPDGMFDAPCGACEAEIEAEWGEEQINGVACTSCGLVDDCMCTDDYLAAASGHLDE